jgi:hypothetical protein
MCRNAPPVAIAVSYNCYDIYNLLLSHGASLTNKGAGYDVIHAAAACDSLAFLKKLVEVDSLNIEQRCSHNELKKTPVFFAAQEGKLDNLKYLVEQGAALYKYDKDHYNIFHYASNLEVFQYLEKKQDPPIPLIHSIVEQDNKELFDYYIANYHDVKRKDSRNFTAIYYLMSVEKNKDYFFKVLTEQYHLYPTFKLKLIARLLKDKELLKLISEFKKNN